MTHRRILVYFRPRVWVVIDILSGAAQHDAEWRLLLHPETRVISPLPAPTASVAAAARPTLYLCAAEGQFESIAAPPWSPAYGVHRTTSGLRLTRRASSSPAFVVSLSAIADQMPSAIQAKCYLSLTGPAAHAAARPRLLYQWTVGPAHDELGLYFDGQLLYYVPGLPETAIVHAEHVATLRIAELFDVHCTSTLERVVLFDGALRIWPGSADRTSVRAHAHNELKILFHD